MANQIIPFTPGGIVDNNVNGTLLLVEKAVGNTGPGWPITVTITVGNPTVVNLTAHGLTQCDAFKFATTGALPAPLNTTTIYYINKASLTANSFIFGTVQQIPAFVADGTPVNTTGGTQSGVQSIILLGRDWIDLELPKGNYLVGGGQSPAAPTNAKKVRFHCYGASYSQIAWSTFPLTNTIFQRGNQLIAYVNQPTSANAPNIQAGSGQTAGQGLTLINSADVSKFILNSWCALTALSLQPQSGPPNMHYHEYVKIAAINVSGGTFEILTVSPLRNGYRATYPLYFPGDTGTNFPNGGPACLIQLNPAWDQEMEVLGLRSVSAFQSLFVARYVYLKDCYFDGQGPDPSSSDTYVIDHCEWPAVANAVAIDKGLTNLVVKNCQNPNTQIKNEGGGCDRLTIMDSSFYKVSGTARITRIVNSDIAALSLGPLSFGYSEAIYIENSRIGSMAVTLPTDFTNANQLSLWTFSNGILSRPAALFEVPWAVPGRKMFISDLAGNHFNMGDPFTVLDIWGDVGSPMSVTSGTYDNSTGNVSLTLSSAVSYMTSGLLINFLLSTGTGAHGSLEGKFTTTAGSNTTTVNFTVGTGGLGAITITGGWVVSGSTYIDTTLPSNFISGLTPATSTLKLCPHVASNITVVNSSGDPLVVDTCQAAPGLPIFSYFKREFAGAIGSSVGNVSQPMCWGNLIFLNINVTRAYSGTGTLTLNIATNTFVAGTLATVTVSLVINLVIAGLRTILPGSTTGAQTGDTLVAIPNWIGDPLVMSYQGTGDVTNTSLGPLVTLEMSTDQGETAYRIFDYSNSTAPANTTHPSTISDSSTPQQRVIG